MNSKELWRKRCTQRLKEISKYLRYMLNGHLLFVLIIALGAGAYYYQQWVDNISNEFPSEWIFIPIFSYLLTKGTVTTFLQEADQVFLLPYETKMRPYFIRSFLLSFILQSYSLLIVFLIGAPLFYKTIDLTVSTPILLTIIVFIKGINLLTKFWVDFDKDGFTSVWDFIIRLLLNGTIVFMLLQNSNILFVWIILLILIAYSLYFYWQSKNKSLHWIKLISIDEKKMANFYRLANLFTDVPKMKNKIKRRKWADFILSPIRFNKESTYTFLYLRSFVRNGDYFSLVVRLTVIGSLLMAIVQWNIASWFIGLLFLYLTEFQLLSMWKIYDYIIWIQIYPVDHKIRQQSFLRIILYIGLCQSVIFSLITALFGKTVDGLVMLLIGGMFTYFFVNVVSSSTLRKWTIQE